jgi:hypothetical protein
MKKVGAWLYALASVVVFVIYAYTLWTNRYDPGRVLASIGLVRGWLGDFR